MTKQGKGSAFERSICIALSEWWTEGKQSAVFWRTSTSGARATTRRKAGKETAMQHGDVTATDPIGFPLIKLMTIELKRGYQKDSIQDLIDRSDDDSAQQTHEGWIDKAMTSQKASGAKSWIIIFKRDRRSTIILLPKKLFQKLMLYKSGYYGYDIGRTSSLFAFNTFLRRKVKIIRPKKAKKRGQKKTKLKKGKLIRIYGMLLNDFFQLVSRKDVERL